jgi:hypothetical protein
MSEQPTRQVPSDSDIISALERTGFLLEHRAAQELRDAGFSVVINDAFPDPETGRSRELDVYAALDYEVDRTELAVLATVLIECKNTANPYLVLGTNKEHWDALDESIVVSFDPLNFDFRDKAKISIVSELDLLRVPGDDRKNLFVGHQLLQMNRKNGTWQADNSSVHDSILYPLFKARQYHISRNSNATNKKEHNIERWEWPSITYFYPVLLTTADIFAVAVNDRAIPKVHKVRWTTLRRIFNSSDIRGTLRMDVVNANYFNDYLSKRVTATIRHAHQELTKHASLYNPVWLLENLGKPRHGELFNTWLKAVRAKNQD